jgi:hypothetical protein
MYRAETTERMYNEPEVRQSAGSHFRHFRPKPANLERTGMPVQRFDWLAAVMTLTFEDGYGGPSHWSNSPNSKNFMASLSPTFHGRSFGTIQEKSKRSPTSSGNGSGGITFANVIETRAQLRG